MTIDSDFAGGFNGHYPRTWFDYDIEQLTAILESEAFIDSTGERAEVIRDRLGLTSSFGGVGFSALPLDRASYHVQENIWDGYLSSQLRGTTWHRQWQLDLGVRLSHTRTNVHGKQTTIKRIERPSDDDQLDIYFSPEQPTATTSHYSNWLPSMSLLYNLSEKWLLRLAGHKSITRPHLVSLGEQMSVIPRAGSASIFIGNPKLIPFESNNADLAFEWYPSSQSFVGISLFHKSINEFESTNTKAIVVDGFTLSQSQRLNQESADARGIELSLLYTYSSGIGAQFNVSHISSNAEYFTLENQDSTSTFAIEGLSPNAGNLILFYENHWLSLRASYNWRDGYLCEVAGAQSQPENTSHYGQWDFSGRIYPLEHWEIFVNAININEERNHTYSQYKNRTIKIEDTGARISLGVKYSYQ